MAGYVLHSDAHRKRARLEAFIAASPVILFAILCCLIRPASVGGNITLSYVIPFTFCLAFLAIPVGRNIFLNQGSRIRVELVLLFVISALSIISLINHNEPFRAFRVLFPSILPFLLFLQLAALWKVSPATVAKLPRLLIFLALIFGTLPLILAFLDSSLKDYVFSRHRYKGFFENPNQNSIVLATIIPLAIAEVANAKSRFKKLLWVSAMLLLMFTLIRTGSKTALLVGLSVSWLFYITINFRSFSPLKRFAMTFGMLILAVIVVLYGIEIAALFDPVLASKLNMIFSDGVGNYYSIESRKLLWQNAIEEGSKHWMIGSGAGERVLGLAHAHNLVLDYFRGVGVFGALAIALLCLTICFRAVRKSLSLLSAPAGSGDRWICACYVSAAVYAVCNQLSDCFGPSTVGILWLIYMPAIFSEHHANKLLEPNPRTGRRQRVYLRRQPWTTNTVTT